MNLKINSIRYFLLMISCGLSACATTQTASIPINVPPIIEKSTTVIPKIPSKKAFLNAQGDAVAQAVTSYEKTGKAAVITTSQIVYYPFAHSTPTIVCSPLQVCEIVMAANEKITGVYPGDTSRWLFEVAHSGMDNDQQLHVIFKPKFSDIATNAIITTDQRTYHVNLQAKDNSHNLPVVFYYPDDLENQWKMLQQNTQQAISEAKRQAKNDRHSFNTQQLDFHYRIDALRVSNKPIWMPMHAFNDGKQVFLQIPEAASTTSLPTLYVIDENAKPQLVNFRVKKPYYMVDQLFKQAMLISGTGRNQQKVTITYNG